MRCTRVALLALAALAPVLAAAAPVRHCLLLDPAAAGRLPAGALFSQLQPPHAGDALRIFVGEHRLVDVTLAQRPGLRAAQLLAAARRLRYPRLSLAEGEGWQVRPQRCLGGMPSRMVAAGRLAVSELPQAAPSATLRHVTLMALPVTNANAELTRWREFWSAATDVTLLPLAAPVLEPPADGNNVDDR